MRPDADKSKGYVSRIRPTTDWETLMSVVFGLVFIIASLAGTTGWFGSYEGASMLDGLLGLVGLLTGTIIVIGGVRGGEAMRTLERAPTTTEAAVLDCWTRIDADSDYTLRDTYHIAVQFDAAGKRLALAARVSKEVYNAREPDQTLTVRYANADPRIALLEGEW